MRVKKNCKEKPLFSCGVEFNNKLYLASVNNNELYEYDWDNDILRYVALFQNEKDMPYLYRTCILYNGKAWFIPQLAENIAIVDLVTFEMEYIPLEYNWIEEECTLKCASAGVYEGHYLYIVPYDIDCITLIDMDKKDIKVIHDIKKRGEWYTDAFCYKNHLYCIPWIADQILKIDISTGKIENLEWKFGQKQYSQTIMDHENATVWFSPAESDEVLKLELSCNEWSKISMEKFDNKIGRSGLASFYGKIVGNKVFILPFKLNHILAIDRKNNEISTYNYENNIAKIPFFKPLYSNALYTIVEYTNLIFHYSKEKDTFEVRKPLIENDKNYIDMECEKMQLQLKNEGIVKERRVMGIEEFLEKVVL